MECEMTSCHEKAIAFVPVLGTMRHVCRRHAGTTRPLQKDEPLKRAITLIERLEYYERHDHFDGYEIALAEYFDALESIPIAMQRAMQIVLSRRPSERTARPAPEKPF